MNVNKEWQKADKHNALSGNTTRRRVCQRHVRTLMCLPLHFVHVALDWRDYEEVSSSFVALCCPAYARRLEAEGAGSFCAQTCDP